MLALPIEVCRFSRPFGSHLRTNTIKKMKNERERDGGKTNEKKGEWQECDRIYIEEETVGSLISANEYGR